MADLSQFLNSGGKSYRIAAVHASTLNSNGQSVSISAASDEFVVTHIPNANSNMTVTCGGRNVTATGNAAGLDDLPFKSGLGENVTVALTAAAAVIVSFIVYEEDV